MAYKIDRESLGKALWSFVPGKPWRLIYFLRNIEQVDIDKVRFVTELGYRPEYRVPGIICVGPDRLIAVVQRYGSLENFIQAVSLGEIRRASVGPRSTPSTATSREATETSQPPEHFDVPDTLKPLLVKIKSLRSDPNHQERAHESLVESFYELLGYVPLQDIKHRQGYIDISIHVGSAVQIVNEVKRDWGLSRHDTKAVDQAYRYANRSGARFVVVTNGDYYAVFDRDLGRSISDNFVAEFRLSNLASKGLETLNLLRKQ